MTTCENCDKEFRFPDYIPYHENQLYSMGEGGWTNQRGSMRLPPINPVRYTPACPHCQEPLYHRDINHYHGDKP